MSQDSGISEFLTNAQAAGIPQTSVVGLLTAHGWREKAVYRALGEHYEHQTGIRIPHRSSDGASAKDAFFYLLIFSTLATWTCGFGSLAFQLIDRWLADPLFAATPAEYAAIEMAWAMSALLIAFPLYLFISRIVLREAAISPEKLGSSVRKWLTYMALVIAASVFMGDLICALAFLLRGELTSRFLPSPSSYSRSPAVSSTTTLAAWEKKILPQPTPDAIASWQPSAARRLSS